MRIPFRAVILLVSLTSSGVLCQHGGTCQEMFATLDDAKATAPQRLLAAARLVSPQCLDFINDPRLKGEASHRDLNAMILNAMQKTSLIPREELTGDLWTGYQTLMQSCAALLKATDGDSVKALINANQTVARAIESFTHAAAQSRNPAGNLVKVVEENRKDLTTPPGGKKSGLRKLTSMMMAVSNGLGGVMKAMGEAFESNNVKVLERATAAMVAEETVPVPQSLERVAEAAEAAATHNEVLEELEPVRQRTIVPEIPRSADTLSYKDDANKSVNLPCSQLLPADIREGRVALDGINSECFNAIPDGTIRSLKPQQVANLRKEVFAKISFTALQILFTSQLLTEVPSAVLSDLGKENPLACGALASDVDSMEAITHLTNLTNLNRACLAAAPGWHHLVAKMGARAPEDILESTSGEQIVAHLNTFIEADLSARVLARAAAKATPPGLCQYLSVGDVKRVPGLGEHLPADCAEMNPSLAPVASKAFARKFVEYLAKSGSSAGVDEAAFAVVLREASLATLTAIFNDSGFCDLLEPALATLTPDKIGIIHKCEAIDLRSLTPEQLNRLALDAGQCKVLGMATILAIGPDRFFKLVNGSCAGALSEEVVSLTNNVAGEMGSFPWGSIRPEHVRVLSSDRIAKVFRHFNKAQLEAIEESQEVLIMADPHKSAEYRRVREQKQVASRELGDKAPAAAATTAAPVAEAPREKPAAEAPKEEPAFWRQVATYVGL